MFVIVCLCGVSVCLCLSIIHCRHLSLFLSLCLAIRGVTTADKLRGTKVWVPTPGRFRPAPGQRPGWVLLREGVAHSRCEGPGVLPRKFFVNSDAKSSFWWHLLWNFLLCKTTAKKLGRPIHCQSPNLKVGEPVSPGPCGCCAYVALVTLFVYVCVCSSGKLCGGLVFCTRLVSILLARGRGSALLT